MIIRFLKDSSEKYYAYCVLMRDIFRAVVYSTCVKL